MTLSEIELFLSERAETIRGRRALTHRTPIVYWWQGSFALLQPEAVEEHLFELSAILHGMGVNKVGWKLLDQCERSHDRYRLDVLYTYFSNDDLRGSSEITYYLTRQPDLWEVELVEVGTNAMWNQARRRVEARAAAAN